MDVILLEKIENLGDIGDQVRVRAGYGRNFLLPKGKATLATPENIAVFEARRNELEKKQAEERQEAETRASRLAGLQLTLTAKAGSEGRLFGSLGTIDIADACTAAGVDVQRSEVRLPDGPLRTLGEHEVEIHLHTDVNVMLTITVVGEEMTEEEIAMLTEADAEDSAAAGGDTARESEDHPGADETAAGPGT